ncbi:hypothetical protein VC83_04801 [Pseudogymnoascus destructans]|uniref:Uncharacterized protein n=1 Tax=Pseudogymnoascus destructans TaxID=655981 RepID=A0A177A6W6_9PEZI|nr:uncharacterized protein VC83_04801 [Pseudogymnoascus destructans]OAF57440.1 hypothetical protein VC83_04801 [Pseudogymnoascus destructans]
MRYQQGEERDRADHLNETLYDILDDDILDNEDIREDGNNEEPILPTIHEDEDKDMPSSPPMPIQHARKTGRDLLDIFQATRQDPINTLDITSMGRHRRPTLSPVNQFSTYLAFSKRTPGNMLPMTM